MEIQQINDAFRTTLSGGRVMLTAGVASLSTERQAAILAAVRNFSAFSKDDDPYGEHDFGRVEQGGEAFFWKIDYYDRNMEFASPDPLDTGRTLRVLTIMRVDEY